MPTSGRQPGAVIITLAPNEAAAVAARYVSYYRNLDASQAPGVTLDERLRLCALARRDLMIVSRYALAIGKAVEPHAR